MQKETTKQNKEIFHLVEPRTLQSKAVETIVEFWNLKTRQLHQLGIQFSIKSTMSSINIYNIIFTFYKILSIILNL